MLTIDDAWKLLLPHLDPFPSRRLRRHAALDRVLAEEVRAASDLPPCDVSALDGFALAGEAPPDGWFPIVGTRFAGDPPGGSLGPRQAMRIMTGSAVPEGADRVIGVEETELADGRVRPTHAVASGNAVRRRGEVVRGGACLLPAGAQLTPAALALLASQGVDEVAVRAPPTLFVQPTGNEVVPADATPSAGEVRDSHTDFLLGELTRLRLETHAAAIARDDSGLLAERVRQGMASADVLLCCGGVSMGDADLLVPVLDRLGCETIFHGVAMQPGKPLLVARPRHGERARLIFGLPGNPASVMVAYWLFVRPALERLLGVSSQPWGTALAGLLDAPLGEGKQRERFVPATWRVEGSEARLTPISPQGSHDLLAFGKATALLRIRPGASRKPSGAACEWMRLDG